MEYEKPSFSLQKPHSNTLMWTRRSWRISCDQERSCSLDQQEPEPPQIQEEVNKLCSSQEEEQRVQMKETDTWMVPQNQPEPGQTVCTGNVVQDDHVDPLHRLLDMSRRPVVKLHRIGTYTL